MDSDNNTFHSYFIDIDVMAREKLFEFIGGNSDSPLEMTEK